jgi:hypothetical protein
MPPSAGRDGTQHGVLTYTVCQILTLSRAGAAPVSYRALGLRIQQQYQSWDRTSPTPMVEYPDTDPDREVLGPGVWKNRSNILLAGSPGEYKVSAGQLTGLTPGSVLRLTPPAGVGDQVLGHVRVKAVRMLDSDVEPCEFDKAPAAKELPNNGRCAVAFVDYGEVQMKVAVATHFPSTDPKLEPIPADARADVTGRQKKLARPDGMFKVVDDVKSAAWLVIPRQDKQLVLMPAAGWAPADAARAKGYGPIPTEDAGEMQKKLKDILGKIARADGLVQMAADRSQDLLGSSDDTAPKFKVELVWVVKEAGKDKHIPMPWPATGLSMYHGDRFRFVVKKTGRVPIDLTVLYVDAERGIDGLFPEKAGDSNRVAPNTSVTITQQVTDKPRPGKPARRTVGKEHFVVLAVKGEGSEKKFLELVQKAPDQARPRDLPAASPSRKLLDRQVHKTGVEASSRGVSKDDVEDHAMMLVSWHVKDGNRPTATKADEKK